MEFDIPIVAEMRTVIRRALHADTHFCVHFKLSSQIFVCTKKKNPPPKELRIQMENAHCIRIALKIYGF